MTRDLIVSSTPHETQVALLEDGVVSELFIEREAHRGIVGNIYKGRVTRVLPGMQSAFVDIGLERDAFLHVADVVEELDENLLDAGGAASANGRRDAPIEEQLQRGRRSVLVQVLKEPLGTEGRAHHVPRVAARPLPGASCPPSSTSASRARSRTTRSGAGSRPMLKELRQRARRRRAHRAHRGPGPRAREDFERDGALPRDAPGTRCRALASRAARRRRCSTASPRSSSACCATCFDEDIASIRLDSETRVPAHARARDAAPARARAARAACTTGATNIFEEHGVSAELERALRPKVWLPSGGYIVINQTEALVAIDVNTGRFVGKKTSRTRCSRPTSRRCARSCARSACATWAASSSSTSSTWRSARAARRSCTRSSRSCASDRSPTKLLVASTSSGSSIITRKRVKQSLERSAAASPAPTARAAGMIKSVATVCSEIYDEVKKLARDMRGQPLLLRVNPEVARALRRRRGGVLKDLSALSRHEITVQGDPAAAPGAVRRGPA